MIVLYRSPENQIILTLNMLVTLYLLRYIPIEKHLYLGLKLTGCSVLEKRIFLTFLPYMGRAAILYDVISRYVLILFKHHFFLILFAVLILLNHMVPEDITVST